MNLFKCIPYESKVKTGAIIAALSAIYSIYAARKEIAESEFVEVPAPLPSDFKKLSEKKKKNKDKDKDKDKKKKKKDKDKDKKKNKKDKDKKKKVYKYDPIDDDINLVYQDEDEEYEENKQVKRKKSKSSKESESFNALVSNIHDIVKSKDNNIRKYKEDEYEDEEDEDEEDTYEDDEDEEQEDIDEDEDEEDESEEDIYAGNARDLLENILKDMDKVEKRISDKYEGTDDYDDIYFVFAGLYKEIYNTTNLFITEIETVNMTELHKTYNRIENLFTWYCKFVASYITEGDPHKYLDNAIRTLRGLKDIDAAMEKYSPVSDEISYDDIAKLFSPEVVDNDSDTDDEEEEAVNMLPKSIAENIKDN